MHKRIFSVIRDQTVPILSFHSFCAIVVVTANEDPNSKGADCNFYLLGSSMEVGWTAVNSVCI